MKIFKLSTIGQFHTNHNEDALMQSEIGNDKILIAVMDGCTMGTESHFASTLICKILRKISKEISFFEFAEKSNKPIKELFAEILKKLFNELKNAKSNLMLEKEELLSTIILGLIDTQQKKAEIITVGDGLVCIDGRLIEYEQNDKPDYVGYHLNENFENWFTAQEQRLSLDNFDDLSIATDGIFTFKKFNTKTYKSTDENELIDFFLIDTKWSNQNNMLHRKLIEVEEQFGLKPSDDLTILRVRID